MGITAFNLARKRAVQVAAPTPKTLSELKAIAKARGIKGYRSMKIETLLKKLEGG